MRKFSNHLKFTAILFCLPIFSFAGANKISQMNKTYLPEMLISGFDRNPAINIMYPGLNQEMSNSKLSVGYTERCDSTSYLWHPLTSYDKKKNNVFYSPYIITQLSSKKINPGLYIGNLQYDSKDHNRISPSDTVNSFSKDVVSLDGAFWTSLNIGSIKGVSLLLNGNYTGRGVHLQTFGEWKSLNSIYDYKRKYGQGTLSCLLSFRGKHHVCPRIMFGQEIISAAETQLDTLFFATESYLSSNLKIDSSNSVNNIGAQIDYLYYPQSSASLFGIKTGVNRNNINFHSAYGDSSQAYIESFFQKKYSISPIELLAGIDMAYLLTFYNRRDSKSGFYDLAKNYNWELSKNAFYLKLPIIATIKVGTHFEIFGGTQFLFQYQKASYNFKENVNNVSSDSDFNVELLPIGIRYTPSNRFAFSLTPSIKSNLIVNNLELSYMF